MLNLPLLSIGAAGFVSVVGHIVAPELRALLDAYAAGDVVKAAEIHQRLLPVFTGMFRAQGVITTKTALALRGLPAGPLRLPLVELGDARRPSSSGRISPQAGYTSDHRLHN